MNSPWAVHEQSMSSPWEPVGDCKIQLQKQDGEWMSFDHLIAMIDHFKLDVGSADAYMTLELPKLRRLWLKRQLTGMKYVVSELGDDGKLIDV